MSDINNVEEGAWGTKVEEMNRLSQRAAKLSERGAHYFVGWLIGAGMHNPAMMAEFEKVLARLEADPELRHCWRNCDNATVGAAPDEAAAEIVAVPVPSVIIEEQSPVAIIPIESDVVSTVAENLPVANEAPLDPVMDGHTHEHARSGMVKFETKTETEAQESQGFFAKLFRRQRVAA